MTTFTRESPALGATVSGLDLSRPLHQEEAAELADALATHQVLFFRGQSISPVNHRAMGLLFGELSRHPSYPTLDGFPEIIVLDHDRESPSKIDEWHIDMSFTPIPPLGSILVGRIMPKGGGDTLFASLAAAYDDLPDAMKRSLEGLTATHSLEHGFRESLAEPGGRDRLAEAIRLNPDVVHPLVRTHPVSGRKSLFYSHTFTRHINGLSARESGELMTFLHRHTTQEKYVYRFRWGRNSIAFWDNRSVIHKPVNDYWPAQRRMERITISASAPPA